MTRQLTYCRLDEIHADPVNPKEHAEDQLGASMDRFGFTEPLVVDARTGKLASGHGRLAKLLELHTACAMPPDGISVDDDGMWRAPVVEGWASTDDDEAGAYLVAANRTGELGGWDHEALIGGLEAVGAPEDAWSGVGFDRFDIEELRASQGPLIDTQPLRVDGQNVRSLILNFPVGVYDETVEWARLARLRRGVDDNASLFKLLLEEAHARTAGDEATG